MHVRLQLYKIYRQDLNSETHPVCKNENQTVCFRTICVNLNFPEKSLPRKRDIFFIEYVLTKTENNQIFRTYVTEKDFLDFIIILLLKNIRRNSTLMLGINCTFRVDS